MGPVRGLKQAAIQPPTLDQLGNFQGLAKVRRLLEEAIGPQTVGARHVRGVGQRAVHDHDQFSKGRLLANPFQHGQPGHCRQVQIQQNQARHGILSATSVGSRAGQEINGCLAIGGNVDRVGNAHLLKGPLEEAHVVWLVLGVKDAMGVHLKLLQPTYAAWERTV